MKNKLLIVDDERANLRLLERLFRDDYFCLTAASGEEAIKLLEQHDVALVITDQRMPRMTGIELLKKTAELRPQMVRMLLTGYTDVEALVEAINCGLIYMYVQKPWNNDDLKSKVIRGLEHYERNKRHHVLEIANERLSTRVKEMKAGFVCALMKLLQDRDQAAYRHASQVSHFASLVGKQIGLSEEDCIELSAAALLHEIGIIGVNDSNHGAPACLHNNMEKNSEAGEQILSLVPEFRQIADIVLFQRENFDGSGNPRGLMGDQIPLGSRILRAVDEYALLTTSKDSNTSENSQEAIAFLKEGCEKSFDPLVVQVIERVAASHPADSRNFGLSAIHRQPADTVDLMFS